MDEYILKRKCQEKVLLCGNTMTSNSRFHPKPKKTYETKTLNNFNIRPNNPTVWIVTFFGRSKPLGMETSTSIESLLEGFFFSLASSMSTAESMISWSLHKKKQHAVISDYAPRPVRLTKPKQLDQKLITKIVKEYQPFWIVQDILTFVVFVLHI